MGRELFERSALARELFAQANQVLGFDIQSIMFDGTEEDLMRTSVTQPAIFIHSVAAALDAGLEQSAGMTAGHSLGEFSALVAAGVLSFEDGLRLVAIRANAMQKACDLQESAMAAIVGLDDEVVEAVCAAVTAEIVVPANYNTLGQLVISGSVAGVEQAIALATERGARMARRLTVNGAFHSPLMEPARLELADGIDRSLFQDARIPVYQNVTAQPARGRDTIKQNLLSQLTSPVRWTQTMRQMIADGATEFVEAGPGNVLRGLLKRLDRNFPAEGVS